MAIVKNINGKSQSTCKCGSWIDHWKKYSGKDVTYCAVPSCLKKNLAGAHVQSVNSLYDNWFIVPLCSSHSMSTGTLDIGSTKLVTANVNKTCSLG